VRIFTALSTCLLASALLAPGQSQPITVYPGPANIAIGTTRNLTAYVPLSPNTITWSVNGVTGGTPTYGTITPAGIYTAPATPPAMNVITIQATSTAYPTKFGTAQLTITQPQPWIWSSSPSTISAGAVSLSLNGASFLPTSKVTINGQPLTAAYVSSTRLNVTGTVPASMAGTAKLVVSQPAPGAVSSDPLNITVKVSSVSVSVSPTSATVGLNGGQQFTSTVSGASNTMVTWTTTAGSITSTGLYTAPATLPNPPTATVKATSVADPTVSATATINLTQPAATVTLNPTTASVTAGATRQFTATVQNNANQSVTWSVNNLAGGNATLGTISATGLYTAPAAAPNPPTVTVKATSVAVPAASASATVTISAPIPVTNLSHARFLDQAAHGPTAADLQSVAQLGFDGWLTQQFSLAETAIPLPADNNAARAHYLYRMVQAPDQLRQRMINALAKIIVISANKNIYPNEYVPYWQILSRNAFGNYRQLLWDITVSPQMGKYLDLANSTKPGVGGGANENYAREVMQLFTLGLVQLNLDGSPKLDAANQPLPTYTQIEVAQTALALTGWTYPTAPGANPSAQNWENFSAPSMEVRENNHDKTQKTLAGGCVVPAGQTVTVETGLVVDCLFNHPNVGPFVAVRLIRDLVTSNPSPAYVQRIAQTFNDNGSGVRGDLKAVLRAILLDPEARQDAATINQGRLKDPHYSYASFVRSLNGTVTVNNSFAYMFVDQGADPLAPPSVFGFYPALFRIPKSALAGPEFQVYGPTESLIRANFFHQILTAQTGGEITVNLTPFQAVAADTAALIETVNQALLYGRMPQAMKTSLTTAINAMPDNNSRVMTAVYLTALSGFHAVQF
jgi:hypothetical protein